MRSFKWANTYIHKTIYWVSKKLTHGHNDAWSKEDEHRDLSVKPEHKIVNTYLTQNFLRGISCQSNRLTLL